MKDSNSWAYPGVKCVCIHASNGKGRTNAADILKLNEIYTVCSVSIGDENEDNIDLILKEVPGPFSSRRFKPLQNSTTENKVSRKQNIDALMDILNNPIKEIVEMIESTEKEPQKV